MNKEYVINHLNIGLFIKELMEQTSIYSLEIDICEEKLLFFPSFLNSQSQIVEWYEKPQEKIVTYNFSELDSIFLPKEQTLPQFIDGFFNKFPLAKDNKFLIYLSGFMKRSMDNDYSYSFYKNSIGDDINKFWSGSIKSFLLHHKLEQKLSPTFTERLNKI